jgi:hypothetical protein
MTSSQRKNIEDELHTILSELGNDIVGKVHKGPLYIETENEANDLLRVGRSRELRAWEFYRSSVEDRKAPDAPINMIRRVHSFTLIGYLGYNPKKKSDLAFQDMVDEVMEHLSNKHRTTSSMRMSPPICELDMGEVGGVRVHQAIITLTVEEEF